jgi:serine/threonine-protein kinase
VHRDVTPHNIFLGPDGKPRLAGFWLASQPEKADQRSKDWSGSPDYAPPEQWIPVLDIDGRADQYSLGVVLFEMLTGRRPFQAKDVGEIMNKHLNEPPPSLKRFKPDLPDGVVKVIEKMLAKEAEGRYPNCDELLKALEGLRAPGRGETEKGQGA